MLHTRFASGLVFSTLIMTAASTLAQSGGAQSFDMDTLNAFASTSDLSIFVFAERSQSPSGTSGFAVANLFNLSTNEFRQCQNANFDITIVPGRASLSFVTEGGFNCPIGEEIVVSCEVTPNSGILHNVTNGTAKLGAFQQQFTTHGVTDTYNNLTCQLSAFGIQLVSDGGSAGKERSVTTP